MRRLLAAAMLAPLLAACGGNAPAGSSTPSADTAPTPAQPTGGELPTSTPSDPAVPDMDVLAVVRMTAQTDKGEQIRAELWTSPMVQSTSANGQVLQAQFNQGCGSQNAAYWSSQPSAGLIHFHLLAIDETTGGFRWQGGVQVHTGFGTLEGTAGSGIAEVGGGTDCGGGGFSRGGEGDLVSVRTDDYSPKAPNGSGEWKSHVYGFSLGTYTLDRFTACSVQLTESGQRLLATPVRERHEYAPEKWCLFQFGPVNTRPTPTA